MTDQTSSKKRFLRNLGLIFLAWTAFGLFFGLQGYASANYLGQPASLPVLIMVWLICGYAWMLLTPAVIFLSRRLPIAPPRVLRNLALHLLTAGFAALLHLGIFVLVREISTGNLGNPAAFGNDFQSLFFSNFHFDYLVYWAIVGIFHLREINRRYLERERDTMRLAVETAHLETRLAEVRLDALKMQIHPHFLFNTLNSISVLLHEDPVAANKMLLRLSELLRVALKSESTQEVALREELEFLRGYLEIEQTRFHDRLTVEFRIDEETLDARVPNLVLQPLVENAIRHGITPRPEAGEILIETRNNNGFVEMKISDNGVGMKDAAAASDGIGLANTRERLERLYSGKQEFEIVAPEEGGFSVRIKIPFRLNEDDE